MFRNKPYLEKRCRGCRKKFETRNPRKEFHSDECRVKNWVKFNKDKVAKIQKRCRVKADEDLIAEFRVLD